MEYQQTSFVDLLIGKRAMVCHLEEQGIKVRSLLNEVDRQIEQVVKGDIISGDGVTKSGIED